MDCTDRTRLKTHRTENEAGITMSEGLLYLGGALLQQLQQDSSSFTLHEGVFEAGKHAAASAQLCAGLAQRRL